MNTVKLCFLNRKGGVGKTTIASNLSQTLALIGKKVLVIDNDEQHNMSLSLGIRKLPPVTMADLYENPQKLPEAVVTTFVDGLDCICGSDKLSNCRPKKTALKEILENPILNEIGYEFIIIDNNPSLHEVTQAAIHTADAFVIPVLLKLFSMQGLNEMVARLEKVGVTKDRIIILRNEMRNSNNYKASSLAIESMFPDNVLRTIIPYDDTLDGILGTNKLMLLSRSTAKSSNAFIELVAELLGLDYNDILNQIIKKRKEYRVELVNKFLNQYRFTKKSVAGVVEDIKPEIQPINS